MVFFLYPMKPNFNNQSINLLGRRVLIPTGASGRRSHSNAPTATNLARILQRRAFLGRIARACGPRATVPPPFAFLPSLSLYPSPRATFPPARAAVPPPFASSRHLAVFFRFLRCFPACRRFSYSFASSGQTASISFRVITRWICPIWFAILYKIPAVTFRAFS